MHHFKVGDIVRIQAGEYRDNTGIIDGIEELHPILSVTPAGTDDAVTLSFDEVEHLNGIELIYEKARQGVRVANPKQIPSSPPQLLP